MKWEVLRYVESQLLPAADPLLAIPLPTNSKPRVRIPLSLAVLRIPQTQDPILLSETRKGNRTFLEKVLLLLERRLNRTLSLWMLRLGYC